MCKFDYLSFNLIEMENTSAGSVNDEAEAGNIGRSNKLQNAIVESNTFQCNVNVKDSSRHVEACYNI